MHLDAESISISNSYLESALSGCKTSSLCEDFVTCRQCSWSPGHSEINWLSSSLLMPATTRIPELTRIPENGATTIFSGIRVGICT